MSTPTCSAGYVVPGPTGPAGANGTNGADGLNAFSRTTADFTVPNIGDGVVITVNDTTWMNSGNAPLFMYIAIQNAGTYQVQNVVNATQVALVNTGYPGNVVPTTVIPSGSYVAPSGIRGATGAAGAAGAAGTVLPTTTKGDLVVDNGVGPHPNPQRLAASPNLDVLHADATKALGLEYRAIDLTGNLTNLSGVLPVVSGGTGGATKQAALNSLLSLAGQASGDLIRYDGANWSLKHTPGGVAAFLRADGTYAVPSLATLTLGDTGLQAVDASWSIPHGLGAVPSILLAYLESRVLNHGYAAGERVPVDGGCVVDTASVVYTIGADGTNIIYTLNTAIALPHLVDKGAVTVPFLVTNAQWGLRVKFAA